jgi:hypothetical protein
MSREELETLEKELLKVTQQIQAIREQPEFALEKEFYWRRRRLGEESANIFGNSGPSDHPLYAYCYDFWLDDKRFYPSYRSFINTSLDLIESHIEEQVREPQSKLSRLWEREQELIRRRNREAHRVPFEASPSGLYGYLRVSTSAQIFGTSFQRQRENIYALLFRW